MKVIAIIMTPNQRVVNANNCMACIPERIEMVLKDSSMKALDQDGCHSFISDPRNFIDLDIQSLCSADKQRLERADKVFLTRISNGVQQHLAVRDKSSVNSQEYDLSDLMNSAGEYIGVDESNLHVYFGYALT